MQHPPPTVRGLVAVDAVLVRLIASHDAWVDSVDAVGIVARVLPTLAGAWPEDAGVAKLVSLEARREHGEERGDGIGGRVVAHGVQIDVERRRVRGRRRP